MEFSYVFIRLFSRKTLFFRPFCLSTLEFIQSSTSPNSRNTQEPAARLHYVRSRWRIKRRINWPTMFYSCGDFAINIFMNRIIYRLVRDFSLSVARQRQELEEIAKTLRRAHIFLAMA